ncbi:hypothetical protein D5R81_09765 [Parashewanella spongiae]|uniref:Lipoprotein n=1 Tax=Parashewanella spongiae TaxID=342950 RepID=A0A3A6U4K4_9GAMM|nr:hypothetical protein [Parashewanella spongiae]MCL1078649.1 hypothetical protein [Parashewanella spongiae]RJY16314.1 hypothetical protein D5R81_09765 [Parashewanella spongiae]
MSLHIRTGFNINGCFQAIAIVVLLSSCSSKPVLNDADYVGQVKDSFTTEMKSNGLKLFTYTITKIGATRLNNEPLPHEKRISQKSKSRSELKREYLAKKQKNDQWELAAEHGLRETLKQNQYCRDGYIELRRTILNRKIEIDGECKEGG